MRRPLSILGKDAGFTIIEFVVAMVIFLIGILGVAGFLLTVIHSNRMATNRTRADQLLGEKIEEFHAMPLSSIVSGADTRTIGDVTFERSWTVTPDDPVEDVSKIEVSATWTERDETFTVESATLRSGQ